MFNAMVEGVDATIGLHICFGNFLGRPAVAHRTYGHIAPWFSKMHVDILHLEFANRGMWQADLFARHARDDQILSAGVVDVKARAVETPDIIVERTRELLKHNDAQRLWLSSDCGYSMTARHVAPRKAAGAGAGRKDSARRITGEIRHETFWAGYRHQA